MTHEFLIPLYLVIAFIICSSFVQRNKPIPYHEGLLWSIQPLQGGPVSYMFGTIHTMDTNFIRLPMKQLHVLADRAELLCLEIVPSQKPDYTRFILSDTSKNITHAINKDSMTQLFRIFDRPGSGLPHPRKALEYLKPGLIIQLLASEKQHRSPLYKQTNFLPEPYFLNYMHRHGKPAVPLEDDDAHFQALTANDTFSKTNLTVINYLIQHFNDPQPDIFRYYRSEETGIIFGIGPDTSLVRRNRMIVNSIDKLAGKHKLFIMVGAAHLPAGTGVLNLLKEKGYRVKRIKLNWPSSQN